MKNVSEARPIAGRDTSTDTVSVDEELVAQAAYDGLSRLRPLAAGLLVLGSAAASGVGASPLSQWLSLDLPISRLAVPEATATAPTAADPWATERKLSLALRRRTLTPQEALERVRRSFKEAEARLQAERERDARQFFGLDEE